MVHAAVTLGIGVLIGGLLYAYYRPVRGLRAYVRRTHQRSDEVVGEDILKALYKDAQYGRVSTVGSLSAALPVRMVRVGALVERLRDSRLLTVSDGALRLTARGSELAVHLVRAHRLWELYLSQETGYEPKEWHALAEVKEHELDPERLGAVARTLGNPVVDPDGDPIPSHIEQTTSPPTGSPLSTVPLSGSYRVTHLEDEPEDVYAALIDAGVYYGMRFELVEVTGGRFVLTCDGRTVTVPVVFAENITVEACEKEAADALRLADVDEGESVEVLELTTRCRGAERQRFLDLGFVPGSRVEVRFRSPNGDPVAYLVKNTLVALRDEQARNIRVVRASLRGEQREERTVEMEAGDGRL